MLGHVGGKKLKRVNELVVVFEAHRSDDQAVAMQKYMKNRFPFMGIKAPLRKEITHAFLKESKLITEPFQPDFVEALWAKEEREYQYAALHYMEKSLKKLQKQDLPFIEKLIIEKSWWDTVDLLASKFVGKIAKDHPEVMTETIDGWASGDHLWLRRSALLFQLKYKEATDEKRLYEYIRQHADSKEFFIQKAIGWALREYSKTNPESVRQFIKGHKLSSLSVREGSKYLKK
jgi:3-methyladenine DNA glycosylase AlkD